MKMRRKLSALLALMMLMTLLPAGGVLAEGEEPDGDTLCRVYLELRTYDPRSDTITEEIYETVDRDEEWSDYMEVHGDDQSGYTVEYEVQQEERLRFYADIPSGNYQLRVNPPEGYLPAVTSFSVNAETDSERIISAQLFPSGSLRHVENGISYTVNAEGDAGIQASVYEFNPLVTETTANHYWVTLIPGGNYNLDSQGLPANWDMFQREPVRKEITVTKDSNGDSVSAGEYIMLAGYLVSVPRENYTSQYLLGYTQETIQITEPSAGGGGNEPGPGGETPAEPIPLTLVTSQDPRVTETVYAQQYRETFMIPMPADIHSGILEFPGEIDGKQLTITGIELDFAGTTTANLNGKFVIDGNDFTFSDDVKRISIAGDLEGEDWPYRFILYQPAYQSADFTFSFKMDGMPAGEPEVRIVSSHEPGVQVDPVALPGMISRGEVTVTGAAYGGASVEDLGGGSWEYLADRSRYVSTSEKTLSVSRYFGMVTIHYLYYLGYSPETAMVSFFEPDFWGLEVQGISEDPEQQQGEFSSGVVNLSEYRSGKANAFLYYLNNEAEIRPSRAGVPYSITAVSYKDDTIADGIRDGGEGNWTISLPEGEYMTPVQLTLESRGSSRTVDLNLIRSPMSAASWNRPEDEGGPIDTEGKPMEFGEDEDFQTRLILYGGGESVAYSILVQYFENDRILGTRQFEVLIPADPDEDNTPERQEKIVYRKNDPEYVQFASANRITAFLLKGSGVSLDNISFGGIHFGLGAGWGHLMPNHQEYGLGMDGMYDE